jgi:two-component system sensor histidine kinase/response regulator
MAAARVLVVDDNDDLRDILVLILSETGFETSEASDGRQAIDVARSVRPDVIIMDIFMPIMDGLTATAEMQNDPLLRDIPVIAQTARPYPLDKEDDLFVEVLAKPCEPELTIAAIRRAIEAKQSASADLK